MFAAQLTEWAESTTSRARKLLADRLVIWGPPLMFGLRLWASVCLALYLAFWLELDNAYWAGTSAALVCQPQLGASLRKGWFRMIGTVVGTVTIVLLAVCFPDDRVPFLIGLALWCGVCAFAATILHNFAGYAAALSGYTAAIIAGDQLGPTGGVNGDIFMLAVFRLGEIAIGIVSAGIVLEVTDLGGARRRLATLFAALTAGITMGVTRTLTMAGPELPDTQPIRRDFVRRVIALDPLIDQTIGESSQIRYHSPVLQQAVDGLFSALSGWRAVANHVVRLPHRQARADAAEVLQRLPPELLLPLEQGDAARWMADPIRLHRICESARKRLAALSADTPSLRLLADNTADALKGMAQALNGLALLVRDPARPVRFGIVRLRIPDWLPALVNAGRAFVTIGAVALFWIVTGWPNGAGAIIWAAISVVLLSPRADQAYAAAVRFAAGNTLAAVFAAILLFAVLPQLQTFVGLSIVLGAYLVPIGALVAQPWQTALFIPMAGNFVPLLAPANQMSYDPVQFYNAALALVGGSTAGTLAFRVLPPLPLAFRTRRLLALTLRDLRRLAMGRAYNDWNGCVYGRLSAIPAEATPLQRAQMLAALSAGVEIMRLRDATRRLRLNTSLEPAFAAVAKGNSGIAIAHLAQFDAVLAARSRTGPDEQTRLRASGSIFALSEVLTQHATYFDAAATR
jgi:uncharacterized membrane protein YccC